MDDSRERDNSFRDACSNYRRSMGVSAVGEPSCKR